MDDRSGPRWDVGRRAAPIALGAVKTPVGEPAHELDARGGEHPTRRGMETVTDLSQRVAAILLQLSSDDRSRDDDVFARLEAELAPGGCTEPSAAGAVEAMARWLHGPEHPCKPRLLVLLADLSTETGHVRHLAPLERTTSERGIRMQDAIARELRTLAALARSGSAPTRAALAMLLAHLEAPDAFEPTSRALDELAHDDDDLVRGAALVGLARWAWLGRVNRELAFRRWFGHDADPGVFTRFGAAVGLAATLELDVVEELLSAVEGNDRPILRFPWCYGSLREVAVVHLARACLVARASAPLARLVTLGAGVETMRAIAVPMLDLVFPGELGRPCPARRARAEELAPDAQWLLRVLLDAGANARGALVPMLDRLGLPAESHALATWLDGGSGGLRPLRAPPPSGTIAAMDPDREPAKTGVPALDAVEGLSPEVARALRQLAADPRAALDVLARTLLAGDGAHPSAAGAVQVLASFAAGDVDAAVRHGVIVLVARLALGVADATHGGTVVSPASGEAAARLRAAIVGADPMLRAAAKHDLPRHSGLVGATRLLAEEQSFHHYQSLLGFIEIDG